nr:DnaD domain protein [Ornithinibacillus massiliensis]
MKQSRQEGTRTDAVAFYQDNFGLVTPFLTEELLSWVNDFGDEFVIEAMKRALVRGKLNFSYVRGIMNSWLNQGIRTVEELKLSELEGRNSRNSGSGWNRSRSRSDEVVPEWFLERQRKRKEDYLADEEEGDAGEMLKEYLAQRTV